MLLLAFVSPMTRSKAKEAEAPEKPKVARAVDPNYSPQSGDRAGSIPTRKTRTETRPTSGPASPRRLQDLRPPELRQGRKALEALEDDEKDRLPGTRVAVDVIEVSLVPIVRTERGGGSVKGPWSASWTGRTRARRCIRPPIDCLPGRRSDQHAPDQRQEAPTSGDEGPGSREESGGRPRRAGRFPASPRPGPRKGWQDEGRDRPLSPTCEAVSQEHASQDRRETAGGARRQVTMESPHPYPPGLCN